MIFGAVSQRALCLTLRFSTLTLGLPIEPSNEVRVTGNSTTYTGSQVDNQDVFLGIPYARPPTGNLRFRKPVPITPGPNVDAKTYGPRCMQSTITTDASEDCLTLNIWRPHGISEPLPVVVWIYGGSFILGESQSYPGYGLVGASVAMEKPVIYVNLNYRLGFFGFPVGRQTMNKGTANLGLYDQRMAIEWVQKNIQYFGGDPTQITLFGESAGAVSVSYQMMYRSGKIGKAFRAAIMQSGAPTSFKSAAQNTRARQQAYDQIASKTGCSKSVDSFECLRALDLSALQAAHVATYELPPDAVAFANFPAAYGPVTISGDDFLPASSSSIVRSGKYANIPIISGSNLDEGTWFVAATSFFLEILSFLGLERPGLALGLSPLFTTPMCSLYPNIPAMGSPYGTGGETFGRGPNYKWAASIVGDLLFTAPRRHFIRQAASRGQNVWSYLFSQPSGGPPEYGVSHASDLAYVFGGLQPNATADVKDVSSKMMQYWINFATTLNPRPPGSTLPDWPEYGMSMNMVQLKANNYTVLSDTFREPSNLYIINNFGLIN